MWGISWANVQMMMADSIRVYYDRSDSSKDAEKVMDVNNPNVIAELERMAGV